MSFVRRASAALALALAATTFVATATVTLDADAKPKGRKAAAPAAPPSTADVRLREGQALMTKKQFDQACPKLEESQQLAPRTKTLLVLAKCHDKTGKIATALREYEQALADAKKSRNRKQIAAASAGVRSTSARVGKINVGVASADAGRATVSVDGQALDPAAVGTDRAYDPGQHTIQANAPGFRPWSTTVHVGERATVNVRVPPLEAESGEATASSDTPPTSSSSSSSSSSSDATSSSSGDSTSSSSEASASGSADVRADTGSTSSPFGGDANDPTAARDTPMAGTKEPAPDAFDHSGVVLGLTTYLVLYSTPAVAGQANSGGSGNALVSMLNLGYDFTPRFRAYAMLGLSRNAPADAPDGFSLANPTIGVRYAIPLLERHRVTIQGGVVAPIGSGGGATPDIGVALANNRARGLYPEPFDPNYLTLFVGPSLDLHFGNFVGTAALEFDQSFRTRGDAINPDAAKTRAHTRLHLGYWVLPQLEPFAEMRYTVFLTEPEFVRTDPASRDFLFAALGATVKMKPFSASLFYARPLDPPLTRDDESIFGLFLGAEL